MKFLAVLIAVFTAMAMFTPATYADSKAEIDADVTASLNEFYSEVHGARELAAKAKGILVMPKVIQGGFMVGGEYGQGALRVGGKTAGYYNIISGSYGFQIGAQKKTIIVMFMDSAALQNFQASAGWEVGADASVAMVTVGAEGDISSDVMNKPIVGFVTDQKGLMAGVSLEGSKFTRIKK